MHGKLSVGSSGFHTEKNCFSLYLTILRKIRVSFKMQKNKIFIEKREYQKNSVG